MVRVGRLHRPQALDALFHPVVLFVLLLLVTVRAFAGSATLAWDPISNPALAGYMLYYGPTAGSYTSKMMQAIRPPVPFPI